MIHQIKNAGCYRDALSQLLRVTAILEDDAVKGLAAMGLTKARAGVVWALGGGNPMTQRDLAAQLRVTPRNITTLVDALEQTGFVKRTPHETDRRAIIVVLTTQGATAADQLQRDMTELATSLFDGFGPEELDMFTRALGQTAGRLEQLVAESGS